MAHIEPVTLENFGQPVTGIHADEFGILCRRLTHVVEHVAVSVLATYGITRVNPVSNAPESFAAVVCATVDAELTGRMSVSSQVPETMIYTKQPVNLLFRAWHDVMHVKTNSDFSTEGETRTAISQASQLLRYLRTVEPRTNGRDYGDTNALLRLFLVDTIGQAQYFAATDGGFVKDQRQFAWHSLSQGLPVAIQLAKGE